MLSERQTAAVKSALDELTATRRHLTTLDAEVDGIGLRLLIERREQLFDALDTAFGELSHEFWERMNEEVDELRSAPSVRKVN